MAYTIQQFRTACSTVATTLSTTFKAGYIEDINDILGQASSGQLIILLLPRSCKYNRDTTKELQVTFFYFDEYLSNDSRDDFQMCSVVNDALVTYLKAVFAYAPTSFAVLNGEPFVIENFAGNRDKDGMFSCSCTVNVYMTC